MEELRGKLNLLQDKKKELLDNESSTQESIPVIAEPDTPSPSFTSPISTSPKRDSITDSTVPSSPLRAHVRAYLPNNQRTTVSIYAFVDSLSSTARSQHFIFYPYFVLVLPFLDILSLFANRFTLHLSPQMQ